MGRPSSRTPEIVANVLTLVSEGLKPLSLTAACAESGITRRTWGNWEAEDPALAEARRVAMGRGQATLERRVLDPDVGQSEANVLRHRLGCIDGDEWAERRTNIDGGKMSLADAAREASEAAP